uniref:Uncharacterized protein n=1 Tax=Rhizophora mucronata TaxID=61149 RepID=A0A2P2Q212_RHIMU
MLYWSFLVNADCQISCGVSFYPQD